MLKIIIPIAGSSELFQKAGFHYPKSLVEVKGIPMIQWVTDKIGLITAPNQVIFIIREEEALKYHLDNTLKLLVPDCLVVKLKHDTKGGLCSVLMAIDLIDAGDSLIITNGDQLIDEDFNKILEYWDDTKADAGLVTFQSVHPRWSYARIENGEVMQTAEKNPISRDAIAGCYYFRKASEFFDAAFCTIFNQVHIEGNYFISPTINEYVLKNKKVLSYPIKTIEYHSFYSPSFVNEFESKH